MVDYAVKKRRIVLALLAYSAIVGVMACFLPEDTPPLDFIVGLPFVLLGNLWCYIDAGQREDRIGRLMKWALVLIFVVGFPVYVFQTRGIRGLQTIVLALLLVVAMVVCMYATACVTLFLGNAIGLWEFGA